jgi:hypothetical protein
VASDADIARAQLILGGTERWSDEVVSDAIDSEGGVPEACVLLLESAATAAAFQPGMVKAGSQSITQGGVAAALRAAAQQIRDDYGLAGGMGVISTMNVTTGRDPISGATTCCTADDPSTCPGNYCDGCCATCP